MRAIEAAGLTVDRIELAPDGTVSVYPVRGQPQETKQNEWDEALGKPSLEVG